MHCPKCGNYLNDNFKHCPYCGNNLLLGQPSVMNKSKKIVTYYFFIIIVLLIVKMFLMVYPSFSLNFSPPKIDANNFLSYIKDKDCNLIASSDNDSNGVISHYVSDGKSCDYQIEYLVISDENARNQYYNSLLKDVKNKNIPFLGVDETNWDEYNKEYSTRGLYYKSVSMLDDSIIYISTDIFHFKKFFEIRDELGFDIDLDIKYLGIDLTFICIGMIVLILFISWWKINTKFGRKGWICLIPIYNVLCLGKDLFGKYIYGVLLLIPIVNLIAFLFFSYRLGKVLSKNDMVKAFLVIIPIIFIPLVAFDESIVKQKAN